MTILQIGTAKYHHQSGAKELTPEFVAALDAGRLADLLLGERWKGACEIIPDYVPQHAGDDVRPRVVVRIAIQGQGEHQEPESYSYLRHSCGPKQGFFWDCYGDDMMEVELALLALSQAPAPYYCGPAVFRFRTNKNATSEELKGPWILGVPERGATTGCTIHTLEGNKLVAESLTLETAQHWVGLHNEALKNQES